MNLLGRIANYFKEWDGDDKTAPKMELSIHDLRYIADMNVERCRLIRQLDHKNVELIAMKHLLEKSAEEIENVYGKETDLSKEIRDVLS